MKELIAKSGDRINGVLSGFDRLVFRGHLGGMSYVTGMKRYQFAALLERNGDFED